MSIFKGAGVAIITPFHTDGSVNYEKLGELIDFQIENICYVLFLDAPLLKQLFLYTITI